MLYNPVMHINLNNANTISHKKNYGCYMICSILAVLVVNSINHIKKWKKLNIM